jgi:hypothetical protein
MRASVMILMLCAGHSIAAADAKTKELAQGYDKELTACRSRADGVARITAGTQAMVDRDPSQYQAELAALREALARLQAYCGELTATLEILNADPSAKYRTLERKLDDQDNKIRKLRQITKKALDDLAPVISRMIPAINARAGALPAPQSKVRISFPSGREIDGPALPGTYRTSGSDASDILDYTAAKATATVTAKLIAGTSCDRERQVVTADGASNVTPGDATRVLGLAWYIAYSRTERRIRMACRTVKTGALVATLDEPANVNAWPDLEPVLAAMIAARP